MKELTIRSMREGAWGLVTRFESGGPEHPEEVIEIAKVVASLGGIYASHIGSEGMQQDKELAFAIRVAEEAKIPVHIFHLKIRGKNNWGTVGKYVAKIEAARKRGLDVTANQYPYTAMQHQWSAFFPVWARDGGPQKFAAMLKDPAGRQKIKDDTDFQTWASEHGSWEGIVLGRARQPQNKQYEGMRLAEIAAERGDADPADTCISLMAEEGGTISGMFHTMSEEDVRTVMMQPWVAIASDGSAINLEEEGVPAPAQLLDQRARARLLRARPEGAHARGRHPQDDEPARADARPSRSRPDPRGICRRPGVFDPAKVGETNSFEKPKSYASGVSYTIVNGVLVVDGGKHTGARPGRPLPGRGADAN